MRHFLWSASIAALVFCTAQGGATSGLAQELKPGKSYDCTVSGLRTGGWIPRRIAFQFSSDFQSVSVSDPIILHANKRPILKQTGITNTGRLEFFWYLRLPAKPTKWEDVTYRVEFDPQTSKGKMRANISRNRNFKYNGRLKCEETE